jgi:hypothetical protein
MAAGWRKYLHFPGCRLRAKRARKALTAFKLFPYAYSRIDWTKGNLYRRRVESSRWSHKSMAFDQSPKSPGSSFDPCGCHS